MRASLFLQKGGQATLRTLNSARFAHTTSEIGRTHDNFQYSRNDSTPATTLHQRDLSKLLIRFTLFCKVMISCTNKYGKM